MPSRVRLHDTLQVGDVIEARSPTGNFTIDALEQRPAVLLAAGIGITPMLAMLRHRHVLRLTQATHQADMAVLFGTFGNGTCVCGGTA
jgi:ferredoxin-NADP reductase